MIETEQSATVAAGIDTVWDHVRDIARWAEIMPGYRTCQIIDADSSEWLLKVGVGGLVRTVKVLVHVDQWNGPGEVRFSYKLAGDPVQGSGTYSARTLGPGQTEIALAVNVAGSGPMAAMWEAMGRPLLPQFARSFADQLAAGIEAEAGVAEAGVAAPAPARTGGLLGWLKALWQHLFGRGKAR